MMCVRLLGSLALAAFLLLSGTAVARAHANLVRSEPAANAILDRAPREIRLWFSEAPEPRFTEVQILDRTGRRLDVVGPLRADPTDATLVVASVNPLSNGIYTVAWRTTSAVDGHVTAGAFVFAIGQDQLPATGWQQPSINRSNERATEPTVAGIATRWLGYLGLALLTGGFAFGWLVLEPIPSARQRRGGRRREAAVHATILTVVDGNALQSSARRLLGVGWTLAVLATLAGALLQAAASAGVDVAAALGPPLGTLLFGGTRAGTLFWVRLVLLTLVGALIVGGLQLDRPRPGADRRRWAIGFLLCAGVLLTVSLGSHAAASPTPFLATANDWLHLLAAVLWAGGLVALVVSLVRLHRLAGAATSETAILIGRFSQLATICIVVIGLTGVAQAVIDVADWADFIDTPYGNALLLKLGLLLPLIGLAALNHFLISRRLAWAGHSHEDAAAAQRWLHRLRQTVGGEVLIVSAVLLATGLLTSLPPARDAFGAALVVRGQAADLRLVLAISPGQPGFNRFDVFLRDRWGRPVVDAEKVSLVFSMVEHDMGETEEVTTNLGDGRYQAQGGSLAMLGTWRVNVLVRRSGLDDVWIPLTVPLGGANRSAGGALPAPSNQVIPGLCLLAAVGTIVAIGVRRLHLTRRQRQWIALGVLVTGVVVLVVAIGSMIAGTPAAAMKNPVPPDAASLARGRQIYEANCAICHGVTGAGDGPAAVTLSPPPADLRIHMAAGHPDADLFTWITDGIAGTGMPAFGQRLSEQERWDVINYIRTFAATPSSSTSPATN